MRFHNARNVHNMHTQAIFKTTCMQLCNTTTPHMNDTEFINEREDEVYDRSKRFMSLVKNQDFESMTNETIPNVFETSCNSDTLSVMLQEKRDGVSCIVTVSILTSPSLLDEELVHGVPHNTPDAVIEQYLRVMQQQEYNYLEYINNVPALKNTQRQYVTEDNEFQNVGGWEAVRTKELRVIGWVALQVFFPYCLNQSKYIDVIFKKGAEAERVRRPVQCARLPKETYKQMTESIIRTWNLESVILAFHKNLQTNKDMRTQHKPISVRLDGRKKNLHKLVMGHMVFRGEAVLQGRGAGEVTPQIVGRIWRKDEQTAKNIRIAERDTKISNPLYVDREDLDPNYNDPDIKHVFDMLQIAILRWVRGGNVEQELLKKTMHMDKVEHVVLDPNDTFQAWTKFGTPEKSRILQFVTSDEKQHEQLLQNYKDLCSSNETMFDAMMLSLVTSNSECAGTVGPLRLVCDHPNMKALKFEPATSMSDPKPRIKRLFVPNISFAYCKTSHEKISTMNKSVLAWNLIDVWHSINQKSSEGSIATVVKYNAGSSDSLALAYFYKLKIRHLCFISPMVCDADRQKTTSDAPIDSGLPGLPESYKPLMRWLQNGADRKLQMTWPVPHWFTGYLRIRSNADKQNESMASFTMCGNITSMSHATPMIAHGNSAAANALSRGSGDASTGALINQYKVSWAITKDNANNSEDIRRYRCIAFAGNPRQGIPAPKILLTQIKDKNLAAILTEHALLQNPATMPNGIDTFATYCNVFEEKDHGLYVEFERHKRQQDQLMQKNEVPGTHGYELHPLHLISIRSSYNREVLLANLTSSLLHCHVHMLVRSLQHLMYVPLSQSHKSLIQLHAFMLRQFWYCGSKALKQIMISLLQQTFDAIKDGFGATIPQNFKTWRFWPGNHGFHKSVFDAFENALLNSKVQHLHELSEQKLWRELCDKVRASVQCALSPPSKQQHKEPKLHHNTAEYDAEISAINHLVWQEDGPDLRRPVMSEIMTAYNAHLQKTFNKFDVWSELLTKHEGRMTACVRHGDVADYVLRSQDVHQHHLQKLQNTTEHARKICQQRVCAGEASYSPTFDALPLNPVTDFLNSFRNKIDLHKHWATDIPIQMDTEIVRAISAHDATDVLLEVSGPLVFDHKLGSHIRKHAPGTRKRSFMLLYFIMFPLTPVDNPLDDDIDHDALYSQIPDALEKVAMGSLEPIQLQKSESAPAAHSAPGNSAQHTQHTQPTSHQPNSRCVISQSYSSNVHLNHDSQTFDFRSWKSLL